MRDVLMFYFVRVVCVPPGGCCSGIIGRNTICSRRRWRWDGRQPLVLTHLELLSATGECWDRASRLRALPSPAPLSSWCPLDLLPSAAKEPSCSMMLCCNMLQSPPPPFARACEFSIARSRLSVQEHIAVAELPLLLPLTDIMLQRSRVGRVSLPLRRSFSYCSPAAVRLFSNTTLM